MILKFHRQGWFAVGLALLAALGPFVTIAHAAKPRVYNLGETDVNPVPLAQRAPDYPESLRAQRATAKVQVEFIIGVSGDVIVVAIASSTDHRFDELCLAAVRQWKFKPALVKKKPVNCRAAQVLEFNLDEKSP